MRLTYTRGLVTNTCLRQSNQRMDVIHLAVLITEIEFYDLISQFLVTVVQTVDYQCFIAQEK